jgi:hypothetical protein
MSELAYDAAARDYPQPVGSDVVWAHDNTHDYEYEQQRHIDAERERENATQSPAPLAEERSLHSNRIPPAPLPEESAAPPSPPAQRGWEPLKLTSSVAGTSLHDGPARTYESPPQEQAQYIPDQAQPPQPQHQYSTDSYANDAYAADAYAADAYATDAYANDPYPADAYAADSYAAETYAGTEYHGQPASIDDPNYEAQTPTQRYSDLPAPRLPGSPASGRNSRRSSGYIPPMAPPAAVYAGVEEYAEDADTGARLSSNTFNAQQDTTRDSYATYDSYPPDSYATFASRRSSDGEEAVVVTIPAEPRTATPTSTSAATAAALYPVPSNGLHATASAGSGSSGPTMSAAAFRGARRARPSFMSEHDDSTHSASPPESRTTTADVLSTPGSHDPPPSYSPEEDLR